MGWTLKFWAEYKVSECHKSPDRLPQEPRERMKVGEAQSLIWLIGVLENSEGDCGPEKWECNLLSFRKILTYKFKEISKFMALNMSMYSEAGNKEKSLKCQNKRSHIKPNYTSGG